jgi:hypothetical protein
VEGFVGRDRGFRSLSFQPANVLSLDRVKVVRDVETASGPGPILVVDGDARPVGWADPQRPGGVFPLGSTFSPETDSLRVALDSALTSPHGLAVAVTADTRRFAGVVSADTIVAKVKDVRASIAESILIREAEATQASELAEPEEEGPAPAREPEANESSEVYDQLAEPEQAYESSVVDDQLAKPEQAYESSVVDDQLAKPEQAHGSDQVYDQLAEPEQGYESDQDHVWQADPEPASEPTDVSDPLADQQQADESEQVREQQGEPEQAFGPTHVSDPLANQQQPHESELHDQQGEPAETFEPTDVSDPLADQQQAYESGQVHDQHPEPEQPPKWDQAYHHQGEPEHSPKWDQVHHQRAGPEHSHEWDQVYDQLAAPEPVSHADPGENSANGLHGDVAPAPQGDAQDGKGIDSFADLDDSEEERESIRDGELLIAGRHIPEEQDEGRQANGEASHRRGSSVLQ